MWPFDTSRLFWQRQAAAAALIACALCAPLPALAQIATQLTSVTITPNTVVGGDRPTGMVTINPAAPTGGLNVRLASSSSLAAVPTAVVVAQGQTSATFSIGTLPVTNTTTALVTAMMLSGSSSATLTLIKTGTHPQVPQGGSASIRAPFTEAPSGGASWDVTLNGAIAGNSAKPNGWSASYDSGNLALSVSAPFTAAVATGYKVRLTSSGTNHSALFDVIPVNAGIPGNPMPAWAEDARPVDSSAGGGGAGPSSADAVDLTTGVYENDPGPDIVVHNPFGPSVSFGRVYRSAIAQEPYGSPGLSTGWVNNFDVRIAADPTPAWNPLRLIYPNGATEFLTPVLSSGFPTGRLTSMPGAPYAVRGSVGTSGGRWAQLRISYKDGSSWTFTPDPRVANQYVLTQICNLVGRSAFVHYDAAGRLQNVTDDSSPAVMLLSFAYDLSGHLSTVTDVNGRQVRYTFGAAAGTTELLSASQIYSAGTTPRMAWSYGYTAGNGVPYLSTVAVPDPNNAAAAVSHPIQWDAAGRVHEAVDANNNQRIYDIGTGQTTVTVKGPDGVVVSKWTAHFDSQGRSTGWTDANGHNALLFYDDPANPDTITRDVNRNGQEEAGTFDAFGNPLSMTNSRGLVTRFAYDYSIRPTGLVTFVQVGAKTPVRLSYYPNGLVKTTETPKPGTSGTGETVTTSFNYTPLGNLSRVTSPAPNNTVGATAVTLLNYTNDTGALSQEFLGQPLSITDPMGHSSHMRWDTRGNQIADIDALGNRTDYAFNDARQPAQITFPATGESGPGRARIVNTYDYVGGPLIAQYVFNEANFAERQFLYASKKEGDPKSQSGSAQTYSWTTDADYRLKQEMDGRGNAVQLNYDLVGNLLSQVFPLKDAYSVPEIDADSNPLEIRDAMGNAIHYVRAADDSRVTDILYDADHSQDVHFRHDMYSRVVHMQDGTGTTDWTYDDLDNITSVTTTYTGLPAKTVSYAFFPDGSRQSMTTPTGMYSYQYDAAGRVTDIFCPWTGGHYGAFSYDAADRLTQHTASKADTNLFYDTRDFLTRLQNVNTFGSATISDFYGMVHDSLGNITQMSVNIPLINDGSGHVLPADTGIVYYTVDNRSRLTKEDSQRTAFYAANYVSSFGFDLASNITSLRGVNQSYDADDRITTGTNQYVYDPNGSPTTYEGISGFAYDPAARPKSVPVSSGLTMAWRGDGLRGWKQNGSNPKLYYLYDGDLPICELDPTGAVVNSYGYGPLGLVQRFYNQNSSVGYILYTFDPFGNLVQRIRQHDLYPADTAVYESTGMLHSDLDLLTSGMTAYPAIDPIGPLTQGGDFTDEETKGSGTTSGLVLEGDTFYDPFTRKPVARLEKPDTVLHGYEPFPHARLLGDILAGGLGGRFGGNAGAAAGVGAFEGLYHYAEGNSAEDSIAYGANVGATTFVAGEVLGFAGRAIARTPLGQAVGGYARRAVGSALGRLGFGAAERATGGFNPGAIGGEGLGSLAGRQVKVSAKGLAKVEGHIVRFDPWEPNTAMIGRLRAALAAGRPVSGADAAYYTHEAYEATLMGRGVAYDPAHAASLAKYGVSPYAIYHPAVVRQFPYEFGNNFRQFWGITR